jgi:hypothetical protein
MKKCFWIILVLMFALVSSVSAEERTVGNYTMSHATYSFTEFEIGTIRITIDQWGDWFWDPVDVFDDLVEEI